MAALFYCSLCDRAVDEAATREVRAGSATMRACVVCGSLVRQDLGKVVARRTYALPVELVLAYGFPFRPASLVALVPMALILGLCAMTIHGVLVAFVSWGVMLAMMFAIVRSTAAGEDRVTVDSMFADRGEAGLVIVRYLFLVLVCLSPVACVWWLGLSAPFLALALLAGYLYFPAGLIAASQHAATIFRWSSCCQRRGVARVAVPRCRGHAGPRARCAGRARDLGLRFRGDRTDLRHLAA